MIDICIICELNPGLSMQLNHSIINCLIIILIGEGGQKDFRGDVQSFVEIRYLEEGEGVNLS